MWKLGTGIVLQLLLLHLFSVNGLPNPSASGNTRVNFGYRFPQCSREIADIQGDRHPKLILRESLPENLNSCSKEASGKTVVCDIKNIAKTKDFVSSCVNSGGKVAFLDVSYAYDKLRDRVLFELPKTDILNLTVVNQPFCIGLSCDESKIASTLVQITEAVDDLGLESSADENCDPETGICSGNAGEVDAISRRLLEEISPVSRTLLKSKKKKKYYCKKKYKGKYKKKGKKGKKYYYDDCCCSCDDDEEEEEHEYGET